MDKKNTFILLLITLTIRCSSAYIECQEMYDRYHLPEDLKCTLSFVEIDYFDHNNFYNSQGDSIKYLHILNSFWPNIPSALFLRFSSLEELQLPGILPDLQKSSFPTQASSLTTLDLSRSSFTKLHKQTFYTLHNLQKLHLNNDQIEEIDKNAFIGLSNLKELNLVGNRIKAITSKMFGDLENLEHLDLAMNRIEVLDAGLFEDNIHLDWLSFAQNQISLVEDGFISVQSLSYLSFADNNISRFNSTLMAYETLHIENNKIEQLHISHQTKIVNASNNFIKSLTCDSSTVLERVHLSNNSVSSMECFSKAENLVNLDLNYNKIGRLNHSSFTLLTKLVELRISHANTGSFAPGILSQQENLEFLDLSYNKLGSIPMDVYAVGPLKELLLDGNDLTEIQYQRLSAAHPELKSLGIGDNYFNCSHLSEVIAFFKAREVNVFASSGVKVLHSANFKGIGCDSLEIAPLPQLNTTNPDLGPVIQTIQSLQVTIQNLQAEVKDLTSQVRELKDKNARMDEVNLDVKERLIKVELRNVQNTSDSATMLWPLVNQLNNITLERQQLSNTIQIQRINQTQHEIELLWSQIKDQRPNQYAGPVYDHSVHSDIMLLKSFMFTCIFVGIVGACMIAYNKLKKLSPMRRYNTQTTLNTNIEMNHN